MSIRHMVVISDLHIGSTVALCPDEFTTDDGNILKPNPIQAWVRQKWQTFWDVCVPTQTNGEPFITVINGETVEGDHHNTWQLMTRNPGEQREMAKMMLHPIRQRSAKLYVVRGTPAHSGNQATDDEDVARAIDAHGVGHTIRFDGNPKRKTEWELRLEWGPYHCVFRHHIGGGKSWAGKLTGPSKEMLNELAESAAWEETRADLMFYGHIHEAKGGWFPTKRGRMSCYVSPSWQAMTQFARRAGFTLGMVGGYICSYDEHGYYIRDYVWRVPRNGVVPEVKLTSSRSCKSSPKSKRKTAKAGSRRGK